MKKRENISVAVIFFFAILVLMSHDITNDKSFSTKTPMAEWAMGAGW